MKLSTGKLETDRTKSMSYLQKALGLEKKLSDTTLISLYATVGNSYRDQESYYLALNYFYKGLALVNKNNPSQNFSILNNIGGCYYFMGNYKKARYFWEKSLKNFISSKPGQKSVEGSIIYNNLAVLEKEQGNFTKALDMLKEFKTRNEILKDTPNIIMALENIADVNRKLKKTDLVIKNLSIGISLATKIDSRYDLASLYNKLGETYLNDLKKKDSAFNYLEKAYILANRSNFCDIKLVASEKLVDLYEGVGDYQKAVNYLHIAKSLSESNINQESTKKTNRLEIEFNEKMMQNEFFITQKKKERLFIFGMILLLLFSFIIFLMFKLQKSKAAARAVENELLAKKLEDKNKELTNSAIQMLQTSEFLQTTQKELSEIHYGTESSDSKISQIISDLKKNSKNFGKEEFNKIFMETDESFYKKLLQEFPTLTKNELRLCALLKLNLSSKEISDITHQSTNSIIVARSRLRKKLLLPHTESLSNFLIKY